MGKKRIQKAIKKHGAFKERCGGKVTASCIERGLKSTDPKIRRRANLAKTLMGFHGALKNKKK